MKALQAVLSNLFDKIVTQEFIPEGIYVCKIPFSNSDVFINGWRLVIRYCGREWKKNRNEFMLKRHGMNWEDSQKEENSHLFRARIINY